jgi:putative DNA primase/helicase
MLEGAILWRRQGLNPPAAVIDATNQYLESEDVVSAWIADRCEVKESYQDTAANLFASWKAWAELMGEEPGSQKALSAKLQEQHGMKQTKIGHSKARGYQGLRLVETGIRLEAEARNWVDHN